MNTSARSSRPWPGRDVGHWLAVGLGTGLLPWAPGTAGSLLGCVLALWLATLGGLWYGFGCLVGALLGLWLCDRAERVFGAADHPAIVWDEVVGQLFTLWGLPAEWPWLMAGFGLFRLLDILKPGPIGWLDRRVAGGLGIMLDDLAAGLIANGFLHLCLWLSG